MEATTTKTEANEKIEARPEVNLMPRSRKRRSCCGWPLSAQETADA